jgi:hypothetical protein
LVVNPSRRGLNPVLILAVVAVTLVGSRAAADGFSLSKLNPFASDEKPKPKSKSVANKNKDSGWLKWPFASSSSTVKKPAAKATGKTPPSTWSKLNSGTKKLFAGTKSALTPGGKKPAAKDSSASGFAGGSTGSRNAKKEEPQGNILTSWFKPAEPEAAKKPKRPSDWVGGERP